MSIIHVHSKPIGAVAFGLQRAPIMVEDMFAHQLMNRTFQVDRLLNRYYFHGRSAQNYFDQSTSELIDDHYVTSNPFELITRFLDRHQEANYMEEKEEDFVLEYFKTRTHCAAALKDGINNSTKTYEEICAICQAEFEHEETIGTLGCGHEYHTSCIKQWLLRKKDCPMCRASVLPFTST
ncbi:hypothetical protein HAX54_008050 [Datura stramonium]|uniref:RING-type E3 ubiquitin transferase n=1 Tax=Datura stramonium TaxID=4076 RepID=A0ABS8TCN2_DATST|nr:hypothetical protein [Datura stramonium]